MPPAGPSGVLAVDKPSGLTSFDVVDRVRRARGVRKAGHAGTLDPMATGLLLVCIDEATKLVPFLMEGEKEYWAEAQLGVETDTQDATGEAIARCDASAVSATDAAAALLRFRGKIRQKPPMYSAIKRGGRRLHELARAGIEVEREEREIEIHEIELQAFDAPRARFTFRVACSKGTYIRTLASDLGKQLGVGAHLMALRRVRSGSFHVKSAVDLEDAASAPLVSCTQAVAFLPAFEAPIDVVARVRRDGRLTNLSTPMGRFRLVSPTGDLVAVAERDETGTRIVRMILDSP